MVSGEHWPEQTDSRVRDTVLMHRRRVCGNVHLVCCLVVREGRRKSEGCYRYSFLVIRAAVDGLSITLRVPGELE